MQQRDGDAPTARFGRRWWLLLALAGVLGAAALIYGRSPATRGALPEYGQMPAFQLTNQDGQTVDSAQLSGRVLLVDFIYTHCPDICPLLTRQMRAIQQRLAGAGLLDGQVLLLSITVDPERDTPAVLQAYAQQYQADTRTWYFLTGPLPEIERVVTRGFLVGFTQHEHQHGETYMVDHSSRFVLVDQTGQMRAFYLGEEVSPDQILADIRSLQ